MQTVGKLGTTGIFTVQTHLFTFYVIFKSLDVDLLMVFVLITVYGKKEVSVIHLFREDLRVALI